MQIVLYCSVFYNNVFRFYVVVGNKLYLILSYLVQSRIAELSIDLMHFTYETQQPVFNNIEGDNMKWIVEGK